MIKHELRRGPGASMLRRFLTESLAIEAIYRGPTAQETDATITFLSTPLSLESLRALQTVYAPGCPLRNQPGDDVGVGRYVAPPGGPEIESELRHLLSWSRLRANPYLMHVEFELLHPFRDGNGRTGRALWAYVMNEIGEDPFDLPFLHRFYYQTLHYAERASVDWSRLAELPR